MYVYRINMTIIILFVVKPFGVICTVQKSHNNFSYVQSYLFGYMILNLYFIWAEYKLYLIRMTDALQLLHIKYKKVSKHIISILPTNSLYVLGESKNCTNKLFNRCTYFWEYNQRSWNCWPLFKQYIFKLVPTSFVVPRLYFMLGLSVLCFYRDVDLVTSKYK